MKEITILLAEDHTIVREGFHKVIELEADLEVVGEAQDGRQAVALAKKLHPDVVLMDIAMPMLNDLQATRQILKDIPAAKVLMLSAHIGKANKQIAAELGVGMKTVKNTASTSCRNSTSTVPPVSPAAPSAALLKPIVVDALLYTVKTVLRDQQSSRPDCGTY
ncbi:MAG: response regulator [Verrucomicrobiota bacterium]|jgi:DNA-binding NarL/FixJ family response regulator